MNGNMWDEKTFFFETGESELELRLNYKSCVTLEWTKNVVQLVYIVCIFDWF